MAAAALWYPMETTAVRTAHRRRTAAPHSWAGAAERVKKVEANAAMAQWKLMMEWAAARLQIMNWMKRLSRKTFTTMLTDLSSKAYREVFILS